MTQQATTRHLRSSWWTTTSKTGGIEVAGGVGRAAVRGLRFDPRILPRKKDADTVSCLVLDVRLPGIGGLDLQAELARTHADIPTIFITGHGDIPMAVKAMTAGAVEFLTKPVREEALLDAVGIALERDRIRRERTSKLNTAGRAIHSLSARERKVLQLVCAGLLNKQIGGEMKLSEVTVKVHRHKLMKKLGAKSLPDLVRMASVLGVTPRDTKH